MIFIRVVELGICLNPEKLCLSFSGFGFVLVSDEC